MGHPQDNYLLLTYDSCRYDVLKDAKTPVLDSYAEIVPAQSPACFTYPAHHAFFAGILPNASLDRPYVNRFVKQFIALTEVGEKAVAKDALFGLQSDRNLIAAFSEAGYQTVGAGAMNWFRQKSLTEDFEDFAYTGRDADRQIDFLLETLDGERPFFGFINFGETHSRYGYKGKISACPTHVSARNIAWPPVEEGAVGRDDPGYWHQVEAAEFLDSRLTRLFSELPVATTVILCADHGECFGEDGYWGHGVNHEKVFEVPLAIFRLDRNPIDRVSGSMA